MNLDCNNCGRCCYSEIPSSWYLGNKILDYEEAKKYPKRDNTIILKPEEVKLFWSKNLGTCLKIDKIISKEEKKIVYLFITIKNFPKMIEGSWFLCCPLLDPQTKKCRIYNTPLFPYACKEYPFTNINEGCAPLCEQGRINGELTNDQHKFKFNMPISLDLSGKIEPDYLKNLLDIKDNTQILGSLLQETYGSPEKLRGQEVVFTRKLFYKVNREVTFFKANFYKNNPPM